MVRKYAEDTQVPISRSREAIQQLLQQWGATGVSWEDDFEHDRATLRFAWRVGGEGQTVRARFTLRLRPVESIREQATTARGKFSEPQFRDLMNRRGRYEHRVMLLWLKAAFNAVELNIVAPEVLFLPFLEGQNGITVGEALAHHVGRLGHHDTGTFLMLTSGGRS